MTLWPTLVVSLTAFSASAQVTNPESLSRHGASSLVFPRAGVPLSLEQSLTIALISSPSFYRSMSDIDSMTMSAPTPE